ncbi:hypothetical protein KVP40.0188 [Vibrio phage KVP40]|uniref:Uncharacterized protein n=3 Tax=Schizotequatrovirus KVP40 TaxID=1914019 RepID=Q6WHW6_BPKVM|nr:hypothetical protein KVP40.0188 [Vibrio phage KVP40]AAQ64257.1 hypothetical protein KVP40.0188 [Vibrio phage KVP40]AFN37419.1 hypothetical protein pp2_186 [Vibrio phage phi-pp2]QHJ74371.1 hypothetical protein VH12019_00044 [Vibrio phage VH1_2019]
MSQMEYNKGVLHPTSKSIEELAEELVTDLPSYYDSKVEYLLDNHVDYGLVLVCDKPYTVTFEAEREDLYHLARADVQENGDIHFETYHYNGGAHWTEVVEDALREVKQ